MQYFFAKYIYVCTFKMQTRKMCAENITSKSNIATQNPYWRRGQTTRDSTWAYTVILHMHEHTCAPTPRVCCRHARHWYKLKAKLLLCIISYVATNKTSVITQIGSIYAYVCIYDWRRHGGSRVQQNEARYTQRALQKWRVYIVQAVETAFKAKIIKCGKDIYLLKWKTWRPVQNRYMYGCVCVYVYINMRCHSDKIMCLD